jgi:two-component system NtrC family sensor kinase
MRLSIATKVFLGFVAVLICSAAVSGYGIVRLRAIGRGLSLLSRPYMPLTRAVSTLEAFQKLRERNTDALVDAQEPKVRQNAIALDSTYFARVVQERLDYAQKLVQQGIEASEDPDELARIQSRLSTVGARIKDEDRESAAVGQLVKAEQPQWDEAVRRLKTAERRVDSELRQLGQVLQDQMNAGVSEAERQERVARWAVIGLSALMLCIGLLVMWISQRALRPIRVLTEAAQQLGRVGPESVKVPEQGGDELSLLAHEFNAMAQRLAERERELRAQGEALLRSERLAAIGRIAAQITHEIRNPLNSISLNAEELGERIGNGGGAGSASDGRSAEARSMVGARELCDAIAREVDRLTAITEEYLRFARLPKPQMQGADVNDTVRELLDFVRPELDAGRISLQTQLSPELPRVHADVAQLRQLLLNLVRNAREAMPGGGALNVATRGGEGSVSIEVRDTGHGIPPERLQRIFDPFFTTKERGTGLGLAMSQEIAQEHGGQLSCESEVGKGTAFTLRLPALLPANASQPIAQA